MLIVMIYQEMHNYIHQNVKFYGSKINVFTKLSIFSESEEKKLRISY